MKTLFLILMLIPLFASSQPKLQQISNLFIEWNFYLEDCNTLVADTVQQSGVVNVIYKPVMFEGKISHYLLAPVDTVWQKVECSEYKSGLHFFTSNIENYRLNSLGSLAINTNSITYSKPEQVNNKINITRNKICMIKKQKAEWSDFWDRWCKEKGIVKFN